MISVNEMLENLKNDEILLGYKKEFPNEKQPDHKWLNNIREISCNYDDMHIIEIYTDDDECICLQKRSMENSQMSYGIDLSSWDDIMGYYVNTSSIITYGPIKIMIYIINNMTFCGFDKEERNQKIKSIIENFQVLQSSHFDKSDSESDSEN